VIGCCGKRGGVADRDDAYFTMMVVVMVVSASISITGAGRSGGR
jgi:hypothetical protein